MNKNQNTENINDDDFFAGMSPESRALFERALSEAWDSELRQIEEDTKNIEIPPPSKRYKVRMNRLFRERVGGSFLPFPEVDCFYERARSKIIVKLKINEFLERREKRKWLK